MEECVFCKIVNKEEPTERIIFEDQDFLAFKVSISRDTSLLIPKNTFFQWHMFLKKKLTS